MTCRELADFLMDYLSGDLPDLERTAFERHLSLCQNCEEYLRQYQTTVEAGRRAFAHPDDNVPVDVPEQLVLAILAARRTRS
jgi:anti-sigma factor RsiW